MGKSRSTGKPHRWCCPLRCPFLAQSRPIWLQKTKASEKSTGGAESGGSSDVIRTHSYSLLEVETVPVCLGYGTLSFKIRKSSSGTLGRVHHSGLYFIFSCPVLCISSILSTLPHGGKMAANPCRAVSHRLSNSCRKEPSRYHQQESCNSL